MAPRDAAGLIVLAALWGASFLCMRLGAGEFGPLALTELRLAGAALVLLPLLALKGGLGELRRHWRPIAVVGLVNSALPFVCYGYAALSISAGLASIFNAASPLCSAVIAWSWLGERPTAHRLAGLALGFGGVVGLALHTMASHGGGQFAADGSTAAVLACLLATVGYGVTPSYTRRCLVGVSPLAVAAGSQLAAALALAAPAAWTWPAVEPSPRAWAAAVVLALACTGLAYLLYFRLFARIGATNAIAVTFLIPLFAVLWAGAVLGETVTPAMAVGGLVIVAGTALATGAIGRPAAARPAR